MYSQVPPKSASTTNNLSVSLGSGVSVPQKASYMLKNISFHVLNKSLLKITVILPRCWLLMLILTIIDSMYCHACVKWVACGCNQSLLKYHWGEIKARHHSQKYICSAMDRNWNFWCVFYRKVQYWMIHGCIGFLHLQEIMPCPIPLLVLWCVYHGLMWKVFCDRIIVCVFLGKLLHGHAQKPFAVITGPYSRENGWQKQITPASLSHTQEQKPT